ncbi:unnamed protein product [Brachionus calyciflorus]|uniref:DUF6570 domain-containing protein n=1 Tax=Brachionus calyciflorus TaxID=104777 RepID=A0A814PRP2_9BILA|nr:unnamed protein product [Brachionus calyciflorus]
MCKHCGVAGHVLTRSINCLQNPNRHKIETVITKGVPLPNTPEIEYSPASPSVSIQNNNNNQVKLTNNKSKYPRTPEQILWSNSQQRIRRCRNLNSSLSKNMTKEKYLCEFDSEKNGPLNNQDWTKDNLNYCSQCKDDPVKYSRDNNMVPGLDDLPLDIKPFFEKLTMVEEMLIAPIIPIMSVYRLHGGALSSRGFCANFGQNIQELVTELPRLPRDLPLIIFKKKNQLNQVKHFVVNRKRVEVCLRYLCENNPSYISYEINEKDELTHNSIDSRSGPELMENSNVIVENQNIDESILNDDVNLFPNGAGDPTIKSRLKDVSESLGFKHLLKSVAINSKTGKHY